jgi:hypothetical protein
VLYLALKATALLRQPPGALARAGLAGAAAYLTVWPGMDPRPFEARAAAGGAERAGGRDAVRRPEVAWRWLARGLAGMAAGGALLLALAAAAPALGDGVLGWGGIAGLLLAVHLGWADVLCALLRLAGFRVGRLFDAPLASRSLADFWSRRWNLAFVDMDRLLFLGPLRRLLGRRLAVPAVFGVSGLLHELAISYPAGAGWGGPMAYFALHAALVAAEPALRVGRWPLAAARAWTWLWLLGPLPLLFHADFRAALVVPLVHALHEVIA